MITTLQQVSALTYARQYNWAIKFEGAPAPFAEFFPAVSCKLMLSSGNTKPFSVGTRELKIMSMGSAGVMDLSFLDDDKHSLMGWIQDWYELMIPSSGRVLAMSSAVKKCYVVPLTLEKTMARDPYALWVVPDGEFFMSKSTESAAQVHDVSFYVAGRVIGSA